MAKPGNWNHMPQEDKESVARLLLASFRGQLIISQALVIAARTLRQEEYPEESNAQDMDILSETLFPMYAGLDFAKTELAKMYKQQKKAKKI